MVDDAARPLPCSVDIRGVPGARRTEGAGWHEDGLGGCLRVRLAAPPVCGRHHQALLAWFAAELGLPRRALTLTHGATARRKRVRIDASPSTLATWLQTLGTPPPAP